MIEGQIYSSPWEISFYSLRIDPGVTTAGVSAPTHDAELAGFESVASSALNDKRRALHAGSAHTGAGMLYVCVARAFCACVRIRYVALTPARCSSVAHGREPPHPQLKPAGSSRLCRSLACYEFVEAKSARKSSGTCARAISPLISIVLLNIY
eukprot:COSAG03_NODE_1680_length_3653_cov_5.604108_2_plen_153_part_00